MAMDPTVRDDPIISPLLEHQHQDFPCSYEGRPHNRSRPGANGHSVGGPSDRSCSPLRFIFFIGFKWWKARCKDVLSAAGIGPEISPKLVVGELGLLLVG